MREGNIPESCLSAASSKAALGPLWSLDYPPPPMTCLHVTTSAFKDRCPDSQSQAEVEISQNWYVQGPVLLGVCLALKSSSLVIERALSPLKILFSAMMGLQLWTLCY